MRMIPKDRMAGRFRGESQKRADERPASHRQQGAAYKEALEQYEKGLQSQMEEIQQLSENVVMLQGQKDDLQFLKEKQDYVLRNFPTLESNVVEKLKGAMANHAKEVLDRLEEIERAHKKQNIWTKVLLWISVACGLASVGGVLVILLYLADWSSF